MQISNSHWMMQVINNICIAFFVLSDDDDDDDVCFVIDQHA